MNTLILGTCIGVVLLAGCGEQAQSGSSNVVHRKGEPDVVTVRQEDQAMNQAIQTARRTVKTFIVALGSPQKDQERFSIKKRFQAGEGSEHIWLNNVTYDGSVFHGEVANEPLNVHTVKLGDRVSVAPADISDWMYGEKGKLVGGYTIRVLCKGLSSTERKQVEQEMGLRLE